MAVAVALLAYASPGAAASQAPLNIGTKKQLFVDHRFIESSEGVSLTMNPPYQTGEKLIVADQPWEKDGYVEFYSSVLREEGPDGPRVRVWYSVLLGPGRPGAGRDSLGALYSKWAVAYAESDDGIHFRKPLLGLVEKDGSKENNLVMPTDFSRMKVGGGSVFLDENPECPPGERYKSWSKLYTKDGARNRIWYSADGLRWNLYDTVPTGLRAADTQPTWFWDPRIGRYVGYSRELPPRMVGYNESDDMLHWENLTLALKPDALDLAALSRFLPHSPVSTAPEKAEQVETVYGKGWTVVGALPLDFYGPCVFRYTEAQDVYISMLPVYYHWRAVERNWPATADVKLAVSRDGRNFQRVGHRGPFLRLAPSGSFGSRWVWALPRPIRMGDELWIYTVGANWDHNGGLDPQAKQPESALSRAILRLDGFVSADASYRGGWLRTPPLIFDGRELELNLDTSAGGVAALEIQDAAGKPIPGYTLAEADELNGNSVRFTVSWRGKSDVSGLANQPVRLHFKLRDCKLYAFQFVDR